MGRRCRCGSVVWVGDDDDGDEDNGFGVWVMKVLGLEVGVGEGVEAVGLSGFVVEVVVVGLPIWCWRAMGCGSAALWVEVWICGSADGLGGAHEFVCLICLGCSGSANGFAAVLMGCCGGAGFVWVGVWPGFGGWICLGWGLAGFALSWIFGCGGCGGGCWLLAEGC